MPGSAVETPQRAPRLRWIVSALGIAQIISWGSLFYPLAVLAPDLRRDLALGDVEVFGSFTIGLFVSGLVSPAIGRLIDARGGRSVLAAGSLVAAAALVALALAQGLATLVAGYVLAGVAMAACLYDPAFATLHRISGTAYRKAVTALTLFGGFASTVFWPLSQALLESVGWRGAFLVFAVLNLAVCLPLHVALVPRGSVGARADDEPEPGDAPGPARPAVLAWLATALALAAFLASALSAHVIGLLVSSGLTARDAVLVSSLIGAMQVAGRIVEFTLGRRLRALTVGTLAFALLAIALALLTQVRGLFAVAVVFAGLYGWSNGVMTIVRGTVPAVLFGQHRFGALLGRLARPQFVARAVAPLAVTLLFVLDPARTVALYALAGTGVAALAAYQVALRVNARTHRAPD